MYCRSNCFLRKLLLKDVESSPKNKDYARQFVSDLKKALTAVCGIENILDEQKLSLGGKMSSVAHPP